MSEQTSASQTVVTPWKPQGRFVGAPMLSAMASGSAIAAEYAAWFIPGDGAPVGLAVSSILLLLLVVTLVMAMCAGVGLTIGAVVGILVDRVTA